MAQRIQRQRCYTTKPPPLQTQATFHRPRVRSVASGTVDAKAEAIQQEVALGKQWWRLAMQHSQHWVDQRDNNRHLSHVAAASNSYHCCTRLSFAAPQDR